MGSTSTPTAALGGPVVTNAGRPRTSRFAAVIVIVVALVAAAFLIGRFTSGSSAAPKTIAPAQQSGASLQLDNCRVGQPC